MKLVRYPADGRPCAGLLDPDGALRDLSTLVPDGDFTSSPDVMARIAAADWRQLPRATEPPQLLAPVARVGKFIGVGLNYRDHALEAGLPIPEEPVLFMKAPSCVSGPFDDIVLPRGSLKTDWEVELGIVIGRRASYVGEAAALGHVAGFLVVNDVSERAYQNERGGTWDKGKGCDTFGPIGPWLVTPDEIADPQALELWLDVNGQPRQRGSTKNMIFSCAEIVSYASRFMSLLPGDVITTGTPPGVGLGMRPPQYLASGDVVTLGISGLGEQRQRVVAARPEAIDRTIAELSDKGAQV